MGTLLVQARGCLCWTQRKQLFHWQNGSFFEMVVDTQWSWWWNFQKDWLFTYPSQDDPNTFFFSRVRWVQNEKRFWFLEVVVVVRPWRSKKFSVFLDCCVVRLQQPSHKIAVRSTLSAQTGHLFRLWVLDVAVIQACKCEHKNRSLQDKIFHLCLNVRLDVWSTHSHVLCDRVHQIVLDLPFLRNGKKKPTWHVMRTETIGVIVSFDKCRSSLKPWSSGVHSIKTTRRKEPNRKTAIALTKVAQRREGPSETRRLTKTIRLLLRRKLNTVHGNGTHRSRTISRNPT